MARSAELRFDFLEIGTSDFDSLSHLATDITRGISVEPVRYYLDRLPSWPGVRKICAGVGSCQGDAEVFYIPDHVIQQHSLPNWMRGCNSVGDYHWQHRRFGIEHLVQREIVPVMSLREILQQNSVTELDFLKLDTEGQDSDILLDFWPWAQRHLLPARIQFESNELTAPSMISRIIDVYSARYAVIHQDQYDTVLELR